MESKIRTFIPRINSELWTGGTVYCQNLLFALTHYAINLEVIQDPSFASPDSATQDFPAQFPGRVKKVIQRAYVKFFRQNPFSATQSSSTGQYPLGVVFSHGYQRVKKGIATLSWISDFQHIHLPNMFSAEEIVARNRAYKETAAKSTLVVLSSHDALRDFANFSPEFAGKGRVLNFVSNIPDELYSVGPDEKLQAFGLPGKFIYLPNQFWKHKNHLSVIEALNILKNEKVKPCIICSGNQIDYRDPSYFSSLKEKIQNSELQNQFTFLGLIPHDTVFQLIRQAAFVLNPSLFEGWSTTVEETKSVGKTILLSDIAVHREQNPPSAVYFDPHNPEDLAQKLKTLWNRSAPGPDQKLEDQARKTLAPRMKAFADTFSSLVQEAFGRLKNYHYSRV
jgi:glycosyltransferase involved in cell wall biosynthesis